MQQQKYSDTEKLIAEREKRSAQNEEHIAEQDELIKLRREDRRELAVTMEHNDELYAEIRRLRESEVLSEKEIFQLGDQIELDAETISQLKAENSRMTDQISSLQGEIARHTEAIEELRLASQQNHASGVGAVANGMESLSVQPEYGTATP